MDWIDVAVDAVGAASWLLCSPLLNDRGYIIRLELDCFEITKE
jgi:hypothetical protein